MISNRRQPRITCQIRKFMDSYKLKNEQLCEVMQKIDSDIKKGLSSETHETATIKSYQTYIQDMPTGNENGRFVVLDFSSLNFRVMLVTLKKDSHRGDDFRYDKELHRQEEDEEKHHFICHEKEFRSYSLPPEKTTGDAVEFFDFLAECVDLFLDEKKLDNETLPLGFCFGFHVKLDSLTKGVLVQWSKKFNVSGVVGQDVVQLLDEAFKRKNLDIHPIVLINDTIGCFLSCLWKDQRCRIAVIIGSGTNACYLEKIENIGTFNGDPTKPYMVINTEWGNFGDDGTLDDIRNEFDIEVDKISVAPGIQIFEKMTSSLFLSELVRLTILKCAREKYLFEGEISKMIERPMIFLPEFIYEIESDNTAELNRTLGILEVLNLKNISLQDCVNVKYICRVITHRSANLIAAGVSAIINKIGMTPITVAFDGSTFKKHPYYKEILKEKIKGMINPHILVDYAVTEDGNGIGAALVIANYIDPLNINKNKAETQKDENKKVAIQEDKTVEAKIQEDENKKVKTQEDENKNKFVTQND